MKPIFLTLLSCVLVVPAMAMTNIEFSKHVDRDTTHLVLFVDSPSALQGYANQVNRYTNGQLQMAIKASGFTGAFGQRQSFFGLAPFEQILVVGSQTLDNRLSARQLVELGGYAAMGITSTQPVSLYADGLRTDQADHAAYLALGFSLQDYQFVKYQQGGKDKDDYGNLTLISGQAESSREHFQQDLQHLAEGVYLARDMASEPGKAMYPKAFVDVVKAKFKGMDNIDIDVLDVRDMKRKNMGALMGVGNGSVHDPKLLVISYNGAGSNEPPIALVGKGVTFDTGGISLKANKNMWFMKSDLSGAAAVAGTLLSVASRGEKVNLVGLMPLAENMPSGDAIRPGDVLNTMQGTTIEIRSTDAEGRLILADAITYAQREFSPKMLVNIATLTGSAVRALSDEYAAVITRDFALSRQMMEIGEASGEHVWPLPLHPNHFKQIKSDIADIKNSGAGNPGASIGAAVVGTFVDESLPWVHLDIAGVDYLETSTATVPKGFAGWGVRFMDHLVRQYSQ